MKAIVVHKIHGKLAFDKLHTGSLIVQCDIYYDERVSISYIRTDRKRETDPVYHISLSLVSTMAIEIN